MLFSSTRKASRLTLNMHKRRENFLLKHYPNCPSLALKQRLRDGDGEKDSDGGAAKEDFDAVRFSEELADQADAAAFEAGVVDGPDQQGGADGDVPQRRTKPPAGGTHGRWMSHPTNVESIGRLDGTNDAFDRWWGAKERAIDDSFLGGDRVINDYVLRILVVLVTGCYGGMVELVGTGSSCTS